MRSRQACYAGPNGVLAEWLQGYARAGATQLCCASPGTTSGIWKQWQRCGVSSLIDRYLRILLQGKPATAFLLELIARLQDLATVPMIDVRAYAKWLSDKDDQ
jgi:hypothetical protein